MLDTRDFYDLLKKNNVDFFTGVPDSQLKEFCDFIFAKHGFDDSHIIAPNEGNAVALAAGHYVSTGNCGLVYMQNSGLGNALNPIASLVDPDIYAIPVLFLIGWRGMPGVHDEPQHVKQGAITLDILNLLGIDYYVISPTTGIETLASIFHDRFLPLLKKGKSAAFVAQKGIFKAFSAEKQARELPLSREQAVCDLVDNMSDSDIVISTTGKTSRELYEYREKKGHGHSRDFLTVGSMGHAGMIALKIAVNTPDRRVWCIDGDGAAIMHLGAMALIGSRKPPNLIHVVINNYAHESVGGMPTISRSIDFLKIASACGYERAVHAHSSDEIKKFFSSLANGLCFLEITTNISSRKELGRPTSTPGENREAFMKHIRAKINTA